MLSRFAKLMLVATSLAPVLGAFGMISYSNGGSLWQIARWFVGAGILVLICGLLLLFAKHNNERESLEITHAKSADQEVLTFLLIYLLPLAAHDSIPMESSLITIYVIAIIGMAVYHSNAFYFNPLLGLLGFHFYEVQTKDSMPRMLIARKTIRRPNVTVNVVQLFEYTYLAI